MSDSRTEAALEWLAFALGDLEAATSVPGRPQRPRIVAFHAQQAAEKALKAALILAGIEPPRSHDLDELRNLLPAGWRVRARFPDLARLSDHAVEARYPDSLHVATPIESATAVRQTRAIVRVVREDFERHGADTSDLRSE